MAFDYQAALEKIPESPGCYLMKDARETVVYVGKAKNLHARVSQYFSGHDNRAFVSSLGNILARIDVIVTSSEREALILEAGLIKRYMPRFNVVLKDGKDMPQLRIDMREQWPRVEIVRQRRKDGAHYFGPYPNGTACRIALGIIHRYFKLRTCRDSAFKNRVRPCLQYEIHRCPAPCVYACDREAYLQNCHDAELFLSGKFDALKAALHERMTAASEALAFEQAASFRDQLRAIDEVCAAQRIVQKAPVDQDYWAMDGDESFRVVVVLMVRTGRLIHLQAYQASDGIGNADEIMAQVIIHHYQALLNFPNELVIGGDFETAGTLLETAISDLAGRKIHVTVPKRGIKSALLSTAAENAHQQYIQMKPQQDGLLYRVQKTLKLKNYPHRIECYDISNMQGKQIVASMVVFIEGKLAPSRCRLFKIRTTEGQDDFGALYEVMTRRLKYLDPADGDGRAGKMAESFSECPDFLLIDGGHGQVNAVCRAVDDAGYRGRFDIIGIAKSRVRDISRTGRPHYAALEVEHSPERLVYPDIEEPLVLDQTSPEILLMAHIRDETHHRAIGFHRREREADATRSKLNDIAGIGPKRKSKLLRAFGSAREIAMQSPQEIANTAGISLSLAQKILDALRD